MLKLFNSNHPIGFIYLLLYAFIVKGSFYFGGFELNYGSDSILSKPFFDLLNNTRIPQWVIHTFAILMVYFQAVIFNQILQRFRIFERQSFMPGLLYLTFSSFIPEFVILSPVNVAYTFIIPYFNNLMKLPEEGQALEGLLLTGFFVAMASLFYFPASFLVLVLLYAMFVLTTPSLRELLMILIGFVLPYYFVGIYFFLVDQLPYYWKLVLDVFPEEVKVQAQDYGLLVLAGFILLLTIIGYFRALKIPQQFIILFRKYLIVFLVFIVIGIGFSFFIEGNKLLFAYMFLIPTSIFVGSIFDTEKPTFWQRVLFIVFLLIIAFFQVKYHINIV